VGLLDDIPEGGEERPDIPDGAGLLDEIPEGGEERPDIPDGAGLLDKIPEGGGGQAVLFEEGFEPFVLVAHARLPRYVLGEPMMMMIRVLLRTT